MPSLRSNLRAILLLVCVASQVAVGCAETETEAGIEIGASACETLSLASVPADASIVLIVNDSMRRDRAGIYGGTVPTPRFDAFAREGLLFSHAIASAPWTKPSVASLFTSLHPSQHGLASDPVLRDEAGMPRRGEVTRADVLPSEFVTLAEHLQAGGLRTGAIVANPWLRSSFGFAQGFEHYNDSMASWDAPGRAVNRAALAWLQQLGEGERFFLYLHYLDTHRPYGRLTREDLSIEVPPGDTREMNEEAVTEFHKYIALADGTPFKDAGAVPSAALVERAYDRGVENFDAILGSLLDRLSRHPAWPKMAVIVTSDHGESLYERGYGNHGGSLFDDETAVPLVARLPGVVPETGRVDCLVSLLDLMPSLCAYLAVDCGDDLQGWNLFAAPPSHPRLLVSEGVMTRPRNRSARGERWKLLYEPDGRRDGRTWASSWSLYDMKGDPAEQRDRLAGWPDAEAKQIFARLKQGLLAAVTEKQMPERRTAPVDPEMEKRLRALGYLGE